MQKLLREGVSASLTAGRSKLKWLQLKTLSELIIKVSSRTRYGTGKNRPLISNYNSQNKGHVSVPYIHPISIAP